MSHTRGRWTVERMLLGPKEKDRRSGFVVNGPDAEPLPQRICDMRCDQQKGWAETQANARLVAAAPELLEALKAFLRAPSLGSSGPGSVTIEVQSFNLKAAEAAIRKAEGGGE